MDTYILRGEEVVGPLTREEVLHGLTDGTFNRDDFCARDGWPEWRKLGDVYKERPVNPNPPPLGKSNKKKIPKQSWNWRDDPVSERQRDFLESKGQVVPKTKGKASDLISSLLGTGPTPRQVAKLKFLGIPWSSKEEAYELLDSVEADPKYEKQIADWDAKKATLYPDLYEADGSYKNQYNRPDKRQITKPNKRKIGCLPLSIIGIAVLFWISQCSQKDSEPSNNPIHQPKPSGSPVTPSSATAAPKAITIPDSRYWPEKVHILTPLTLIGNIAGGSLKSTISKGTLLKAELSSDHKSVTVHNLDLSGSVPIEETDFLDLSKKAENEHH